MWLTCELLSDAKHSSQCRNNDLVALSHCKRALQVCDALGKMDSHSRMCLRCTFACTLESCLYTVTKGAQLQFEPVRITVCGSRRCGWFYQSLLSTPRRIPPLWHTCSRWMWRRSKRTFPHSVVGYIKRAVLTTTLKKLKIN